MSPRRQKADSVVAIVLYLGAWVWLLLVVPPSLMLLAVAVTTPGRTAAIAGITTGMVPLLTERGWRTGRRHARWLAVGVAITWMAAIGAVAVQAPSGVTAAGATFQNIYVEGTPPFLRGWSGTWVPEVDQLMFGFSIMPAFDPLFTSQQAVELKRWTRSIYRELDASADWREAGSALSLAARDVAGLSCPRGHAYVYIPAGTDRSAPHRVILFLHGWGGNLKGYSWLLSRVAGQIGAVVIAPTWGAGNWQAGETRQLVREVLEAVSRRVTLDFTRIDVVGVSSGARAVCQLAGARSFPFDTCVLVSPVFDLAALGDFEGPFDGRGPRLVVIHGARDERVPLDYVEKSLGTARQRGWRVSAHVLATADHFLFFSHRDEWLGILRAELTSPAVPGNERVTTPVPPSSPILP